RQLLHRVGGSGSLADVADDLSPAADQRRVAERRVACSFVERRVFVQRPPVDARDEHVSALQAGRLVLGCGGNDNVRRLCVLRLYLLTRPTRASTPPEEPPP